MSLANLGADSISKSAATLNDENMQDPAMQDPKNDKSYSEKMAEFDRQEKEDLMNTGLSTEQYLEKLYQREKKELEYLKELEADPERMSALSDDQKADMRVRMKNLEYNQETRDLTEQYMNSLKDDSMSPEQKEQIAAAYNERQADLTEFRMLMEDSKELGGNEYIGRMRDLEKELETASGMEAQNAVKIKMAGEKRSFEQQMEQDPELQEQFLQFVENNRDNKVIRESGLGESVERYRYNKQKAEGSEIAGGMVRPAGKARAGAVDSDDPEAAKTAEAETAAGADDGMGAKKPLRLEGGQEMDRGAAAAAQSTPGSAQDRESAASLGG